VFLNYLLDCLPACVVKVDADEVQLLHARTCLPPGLNWRSHLPASPEELRQLAASSDPALRRELLPVYPLMLAEYQYRAVDRSQVPYREFILEQAAQVPGRPVLHNHGALRCLEALLGLLSEGGLILMNDYGQTSEIVAEEFEHQRFSQATFVGVNFPLLGRYFSANNRACWTEPQGDDSSLHGRLLMHRPQPSVALRFAECFGAPRRQSQEEPVQRAAQLAKVGRFQSALLHYREALARQPFNWLLMTQVGNFLTFALRNPKAGLEMARAALQHNPACSADLWNLLGDSLFVLGRVGEARIAFERALAINGDDVRARYNLAFVHVEAREYAQALARLAEALALDRDGALRQELLNKQAEVLSLLDHDNQRRHLGQVDRLTGLGVTLPRRNIDSSASTRPGVSPGPAPAAADKATNNHPVDERVHPAPAGS
jgi:tetratricopeptide (TPR) repeat protein